MARLVGPALVPAAVAVGLPLALVRVSVLAAALSLLVSAALVGLSVLIRREAARHDAERDAAARLLGLPPYAAHLPPPSSVNQPGGAR